MDWNWKLKSEEWNSSPGDIDCLLVFDIGNWNRLEDIEKMPLEYWEY